jgi:hypothetical protein
MRTGTTGRFEKQGSKSRGQEVGRALPAVLSEGAKAMEKEHIIEEIIRTANENGGIPLGVRKFASETGIKISDWYGKYWAKWGNAIKEAGYEPNTFQEAYASELLIKKLIELIREIGKFPTDGELRLKTNNDKTFPSEKAFRRIGNTQERAKEIVEYCKKYSELSDVLDIVLPMCSPEKDSNDSEMEKSVENFGFVYLMKSGKHYKIGRSSSAGRREYELKLLLPEKVEVIHKIKTDDPVGIEAYWHKRFEDKRKSGEWFELAGPDVKAFKRRKFM